MRGQANTAYFLKIFAASMSNLKRNFRIYFKKIAAFFGKIPPLLGSNSEKVIKTLNNDVINNKTRYRTLGQRYILSQDMSD